MLPPLLITYGCIFFLAIGGPWFIVRNAHRFVVMPWDKCLLLGVIYVGIAVLSLASIILAVALPVSLLRHWRKSAQP